ncbi:hypothetical protein [Dapis sp. BLCC M172]|uniref:hypothetical protein n=1 Tax=Dapis sp. BLCC M172 TaxID=2975281 RepID=UPI003CEC8C98
MVKSNNSWYYEVSKSAPQYALRYLSEAWKRCFNKVSGQPQFKRKGRDDSFTLDGSIPTPSPPRRGARGVGQIKLPRIGWIKTYEILPDNVTPKSVRSSRGERPFAPTDGV